MPDLLDQQVTVVALPVEAPAIGVTPPVHTDVVVLPVPGPPGRPGSSGAGFEHRQNTPATVWTINHALSRDVVAVTVYSLDLAVQWDNVVAQPLNADTIRLSFDDPTSGIALIL